MTAPQQPPGGGSDRTGSATGPMPPTGGPVAMDAPGTASESIGSPGAGRLGPKPPTTGGPAPADETRVTRRGVGYSTYAITVVILLIAIVLVVFVVKNDARVTVWLFGATPVMSVAGALGASAAAGLVIGLLAGFIPQVRLRRELRQLRRERRAP